MNPRVLTIFLMLGASLGCVLTQSEEVDGEPMLEIIDSQSVRHDLSSSLISGIKVAELSQDIQSSESLESPLYECIQQSGQLMTVVHTTRGLIPLIEWKRDVFGAQWTPEARCKTVSHRFQVFSRQNLLQFISTGELNNYPIICVSEEYGDCLSNGLLLTLEPQDNPSEVLKDLFNLSDSITRSTTKPVIDLEYLLEEKKVLEVPETVTEESSGSELQQK